MDKIIDIKNMKVSEIVKKYPESKDIIKGLGLKEITNPIALRIMASKVTLEDVSSMKNIPLQKIKDAFINNGFLIKDGLSREEKIRKYIDRVNNGEDLTKIKREFKNEFDDVSVDEIIQVETSLIYGGMGLNKMSHLCDLHSSLFHGLTEEEVQMQENDTNYKNELPKGHPLSILMVENVGINNILKSLRIALNNEDSDLAIKMLTELRKLKIHYSKKEELIIAPLFKMGVDGPSNVMWQVDDEIKKEVKDILKELNSNNLIELTPRIDKVIDRIDEMIYKEEHILFPLAINSFDKELWYKLYGDLDELGYGYGSNKEEWDEALKYLSTLNNDSKLNNSIIELETGKITIEQLKTIVKVLPIDLTLINEFDELVFFSSYNHLFARPKSALNSKIYGCHPPRVIPMVKSMLDSFRNGNHEKVVIMKPDLNDPVRIIYQPIFDNDKYLGCLEIAESLKEDFDKLLKMKEKMNK